jgi:hypothetical protein
MSTRSQIGGFIQQQLLSRNLTHVTAVDAAIWLDRAGVLKDSSTRPGLPLRNLLRTGIIVGKRQEPNGRWFIDHVLDTHRGTESVAPSTSPFPAPSVGSPRRTAPSGTGSPSVRSSSDEANVIDLCDEILNLKAIRQHRFAWLLGDPGRDQRQAALPVDAYYPGLSLVVEYHERQHTEAVPFFDRRQTVSGVGRGDQRRIYDNRKKAEIPKHGFALVVIAADELVANTRGRLLRNRPADLVRLRKRLTT